MNNYRIRRADSRNLVIETQAAAESWTVIGYFGNNPSALASGLMSLVMAGSIPDLGGGLIKQVENLRQDISEGIERLIKEIDYA